MELVSIVPSGRGGIPGSGGLSGSSRVDSRETLRALIVEDDPGDARLVQEMLRRAGRWTLSVQVADSLVDAEDALARGQGPLDLVLLDMRLPDGEGLTALSRVLTARPDVAVVVLTGLDDDSLARACLAAGAVDYVRKSGLLGDGFVRSVDYALARSKNMQLKTQLDEVGRLAALGEITAGVAHEINNPATYVGYGIVDVRRSLKTIAQRVLAENTELASELTALTETLAMASEGVDRIVAVVRELQDHAHESPSDGGAITDPVAAARSSLRLIDYQVRHWTSVETDFADCPPISIHPQRFGQIVANLVLNAAQAVRDSGRPTPVHVKLEVEERAVLLQVRDQGGGIPESDLPKIFDSFYTSKGRRGGTGLGLSIVREVVTAANGSISVDSQAGEGSVFSIRIPIAYNVPAIPPRRRLRPVSRRRVLLIDDDAMVLTALGRALGRHHDVSKACGGVEALELLDELQGKIDVVLCDLMMPGMDGGTTLSHIFDAFPTLRDRAAVLSGGGMTASLSALLAQGPLPILNKPARAAELLDTIERLTRSESGPTEELRTAEAGPRQTSSPEEC